MIPFEQFRESSIYQFILEEGEKRGFKRAYERGFKKGFKRGRIKPLVWGLNVLRAKRFPALQVSAQLEQIYNASTLRRLYKDAMDMKDADTLKQRLAEIIESKNH